MSAANDAVAILQDLAKSDFWGSLEITFQAGKVVLLKKTETLKPSQRNNRVNENGNC